MNRYVLFFLACISLFFCYKLFAMGSVETAPMKIRESDVSPSGYPSVLQFPNDSLTLSANNSTMTVTFVGSALGTGSTHYVDVYSSTQTKLGGLNVMGRLGLGTTSPTGKLSVTNGSGSGSISILTGSDLDAETITNSTVKISRIAMPHYTNSEEPLGILTSAMTSSLSEINFGGGSSALNAPTLIYFNTAANTTTTTGSPRLTILGTGLIGIGTTSPVNILDVEGGMAIGATYSGTSAAPTNGLIVEGNVGIGTTAPTNKFTVNGGMNVLGATGGGSGLTLSDEGAYKRIQSWESEILSINPLGNNVGIGTTVPTKTLSVKGSMNVLGAFEVDGTGTTASGTNDAKIIGTGTIGAGLDFNATGTGGRQYSIFSTANSAGSGGGKLAFFDVTAAAYRMVLDSAGNVGIGAISPIGLFQVGGGSLTVLSGGNVGIGTTVPAAKLDVRGEESIFKSTGSHASAKISHIFPAANQVETQYRSSNMIASIRAYDDSNGFTMGPLDLSNYFLSVNNVGRIGMYASDSITAINYNGGNVGIGLTTPVNKLDVEGSMAIGATYSGTSVAPTNGLIVEGNVGIGTTAPTQKLDVNGIVNANNSDTLADPTGSIGNGARFSMNTVINPFAIGIGAIDGSQYPMWFQTGDINGGGFEWYIGTSEKMRIDKDGNVGIGITSPLTKLEVSGAGVNFSGTAYYNLIGTQDHTNYRGIFLGYDTSGQIGVIGSGSGGAASQTAFWRSNGLSGYAESMRIDTSGNVGIGTTDPVDKLTLGGSVSNDHAIRLSLNSQPTLYYSRIVMYEDGSGDANKGNLSFEIQNWPNSKVTPLILTGSGNVGIGAPLPAAALHVSSGVVLANLTGNVGIGTTTPLDKLEVSGVIVGNTSESGVLSAFRYGGNNPGTLTDRYYGLGVGAVGSAGQFNLITSHNGASGTSIGFTGGSTFSPVLNIRNSGNVGIGNPSPAYKLHLSSGQIFVDGSGAGLQMTAPNTGNVNTGISINRATGGTAAVGLKLRSTSGGSYYGALTYAPEGGSEVDMITLGLHGYSNVGVGTDAPSSKFDLFNGSITVRGTSAGLRIVGDIQSDSGSGTNTLTLRDGTISKTAGGNFIFLSGLSPSSDNARDLGDASNRWRQLYVSQNAYLATTSGNVGIGNPSPAQKLHLSSGTLFIDGNTANSIITSGSVGVGTTSPGTGAILDIAATTTDYGLQLKYLGTAAANSGAAILFETNDLTSGTPRENVGYARIKVAKENGTNTDDAVYMSFATAANDEGGGASEKLRITSAGSVSISTTLPNAKFHVYGNAGAAGGPIVLASTGTTKIFEVNPSSIMVTVNSWFQNHIISTGTVPTVGSGIGDCGTSPSIIGTDTKGNVTVGSVANGGVCTVTFAKSYNIPPVCMGQNSTTANLVRVASISTTQMALTGTFLAGDLLQYICIE